MDGYLKEHLIKQDMLKGGIKIYYLLFIICSFIGCSNNTKSNGTSKCNHYVKEHFSDFSEEYNLLNDSIKRYVASNLKSFGAEHLYEWQLDSMICINSKHNKLTAVIISSVGIFKEDVTDDATKILGKRIDNKWFFFKGGGSLAIPRSSYGKTGADPLSFYELSQIARENLLSGALIKDENGNYVVNDAWVEKHFYNNGYGNFSNRAAYDSVHWKIILDKWKHKIDTNEYKPLQKKPNT